MFYILNPSKLHYKKINNSQLIGNRRRYLLRENNQNKIMNLLLKFSNDEIRLHCRDNISSRDI